jgi:hypothetical protein
MIFKFVNWVDRICDKIIPTGVTNLLLQVTVVIVIIGISLLLRGR